MHECEVQGEHQPELSNLFWSNGLKTHCNNFEQIAPLDSIQCPENIFRPRLFEFIIF